MKIPENLTLSRAIANFKNNPTEQNVLRMHQLFLKNSYYIFIAGPSGEEPSMTDGFSAALAKEDSLPIMVIHSHSQSGNILPVYTCTAEAKKSSLAAGNGAVQIAFSTLLQLLGGRRDMIQSVIFDPEGESIGFSADQFIEFFGNMTSVAAEENIEKGTILTFRDGVPKLKPEHVKTIRKAASLYGDIHRIWIAMQMNAGEFERYVIVLDAETPRPDSHREIAVQFLQAIDPSQAASICYMDNEIAKDIVDRFEAIPFVS